MAILGGRYWLGLDNVPYDGIDGSQEEETVEKLFAKGGWFPSESNILVEGSGRRPTA